MTTKEELENTLTLLKMEALALDPHVEEAREALDSAETHHHLLLERQSALHQRMHALTADLYKMSPLPPDDHATLESARVNSGYLTLLSSEVSTGAANRGVLSAQIICRLCEAGYLAYSHKKVENDKTFAIYHITQAGLNAVRFGGNHHAP